jgi:thioredoxin-related protein
MKNYVIGFLVVCLIFMGTLIYKISQNNVLEKFPIEQSAEQSISGEPNFYIYIFFSINNCSVCLKSIKVLNELQPPFIVTGIVSENELKNEIEIRSATGATFKLVSLNESYRKFNPHYAPTIFGVSVKGHILFIIPGVPGQKEYLYNFLVEFYGKSIELLIPDSG